MPTVNAGDVEYLVEVLTLGSIGSETVDLEQRGIETAALPGKTLGVGGSVRGSELLVVWR